MVVNDLRKVVMGNLVRGARSAILGPLWDPYETRRFSLTMT